jgi:hypothetical protein
MLTLENTGITNTSKSAAILRHTKDRLEGFLGEVGIDEAVVKATPTAKAVLEYEGTSFEFDTRWLLSQWFGQWTEEFKLFREFEASLP